MEWVVLFAVLHGAFMVYLAFGVNTALNKTEAKKTNHNMVSIVVPFRNEAAQLDRLIKALNNQSYSGKALFLFIDDSSTDDSFSVLQHNLKSFKYDFKSIKNNNEPGKKGALLSAVSVSKTEYIVQLDADCIPNKNWLESTVNALSEGPDLLIQPVFIDSEKKYWFQELEFSALQFITFGMSGNGTPILCNGANMAYKRSKWLSVFDEINTGSSGDDIFLLQSFLKRGLTIKSNALPAATVVASAAKSSTEFLHQRIRWAGKNKNVSIPFYKSATLYFGAIHILPLMVSIYSWKIAVVLFFLKHCIDFVLISWFRVSLRQRAQPVKFLFSAIAMPFYLIFLAFSQSIISPKWKQRTTKL